ncbi:uncharacterized protein LOC116266010 isoform X1 [Nymphaea colorata]|nr:uncharacterized protein LOC116266010 isoform X1 [Nymphaea colorata]
MMFCGRASVADCDEEVGESYQSLPKKSTKRRKNPFSSRGLDKFSSVSNELHSKAQKVLSQLGAAQTDNILIRFAYSSSNGWTPVVVRLKKAAPEGGSAMAKPREDRQKRSLRASAMKPAKPAQKAAGSVLKADTNNGGGRHGEGSEGKEKTGAGLRQRLAARFGLRQVDCWPLALVVLLVCLLVFGRLAAVVCTTIWLYFLASFFAADSKQHATNGRKRNMGCSTC